MPDDKKWGPDNPHPLSKLKTELVLEGNFAPDARRLLRYRPEPSRLIAA